MRVAATAWMSRSRRMMYSSPWTSTSNWSSGLNRTLSPAFTDRTWGPTATVSAQASRRDTWAVAGIRIPARERRSPSDGPTWTNTRSARTVMASWARLPSPFWLVAGTSDVVEATISGYRRGDGARPEPTEPTEPTEPAQLTERVGGPGKAGMTRSGEAAAAVTTSAVTRVTSQE